MLTTIVGLIGASSVEIILGAGGAITSIFMVADGIQKKRGGK